MSLSRNICLFMVTLALASSCTSSKFDFKTAYKFDHYQYQKAPKPQAAPEVVASIKPVLTPRQYLPSDLSIVERVAQQTVVKFQEQYQSASKQQRKVMRKEIKQQFKQVRKDLKVAKKEQQQKDVSFNKKMYIGLVLLLAGIVVAILASGSVGALVIIIGVGLIAWGFIEQA
ncbi:MAG: DUF308 domain-containing protein [Cyclobacteriaceae bacterium]|nr:DUF308 domain-containing protein [Cyclobacteriaceae bacterium]